MQRLYKLSEVHMHDLEELKVENLGFLKASDPLRAKQNTSTLIIGLGSLGVSTAVNIRKTLLKQMEVFPSHNIEFLLIDDSERYIPKCAVSVAEEEDICIFKSISEMLQANADELPEAVKDILPPKSASFNPSFNGDSTEPQRLAGRLYIMEDSNHEMLLSKLRIKLSRLWSRADQALNVHIIAGTGGGIGSGLCIDIPYIIRDAASKEGVPANRLKLCGHIYMPDVYDEIEQTGASQIYRNGYAVLKEIDYYMNVEQIGESFNALYPSGPVSSARNLFDLCTLIGGKFSGSTQGSRIRAKRTCAENIITHITEQSGYIFTVSRTTLAPYTLFYDADKALSSVISKAECGFHKNGNYRYTYVGASSVSFPADTIAECITSAYIKKTVDTLRANEKKPTQDDADDFAHYVADPECVIMPYMEDLRYRMERILSIGLESRRTFECGNILSQLNHLVNDAEKNFEINDELINEICESVRNKSYELIRDAKKGPYYLAALLTARKSSDGFSGFNEILEGYAAQCNEIANMLSMRKKGMLCELESLSKAMKKPFCFRKYAEDFKQLATRIFENELTVRLYTRLASELYTPVSSETGILHALNESLIDELLGITDTVTFLGEIAEGNIQKCRRELFEAPPYESMLSIHAPVIEKLKTCIKSYVDKRIDLISDADVSALAAAMTAYKEKTHEKWVTSFGFISAYNIRSFTSSYEPFLKLQSMGFANFLRVYLSQDMQSVADCVNKRLDAEGSVMFPPSPDSSLASLRELCCSITTIPNNLTQDFVNLVKRKEISLLGCETKNTFRRHTQYLNMPIWLHSDMARYEKLYHQFKTAGIHIDENPKHKPPYTDYPPLLPREQWHRADTDTARYENKKELAYIQALESIISHAEELGIIALNDSGFYEILSVSELCDDSELSCFLGEYCKNPANYSDGELMGGKHLYTAMRAAWGCTEHSIFPIKEMLADRRENLLPLLRRQMKLTETVKNMISLAEKAEGLLDDLLSAFKEELDAQIPMPKAAQDLLKKEDSYAFISYSTKNQAEADAMREFLKKNGVDVWMAPGDIPIGSRYARVINKAIKGCACVVLMLTDYAQSSMWVGKEIERAVNYRKNILSVQLEDIVLNDEFELYISTDQLVAMRKVDENSPEMQKLLASIRVFIDGEAK